MSGPTDLEQYLLELINDARLNPLGDAARFITSYSPLLSNDPNIQSALTFFGVSGPALLAGFQALVPVQPLAWNDNLAAAARGHDNAMIAADDQQHTLPGEPDLVNRIVNAGYATWSNAGENIFAYGDSVLETQAAFMVDWGGPTNGMQDPPGHRQNIMGASFREIGLGIVPESNSATQVGPLVVTEDFGARFSSGQFVLGVAYNDTDHNGFYTPGEGLSTLTASLASTSVTSFASGGYTLQTTASGAQTVTFTGGMLSSALSVALNLAADSNIKLDIVSGSALHSSTSVTVSGPISEIDGLGTVGLALQASDSGTHKIVGTAGLDSLTGGSGSDTLTGGSGNDSLDGGSNVNTAIFSGARSAYTIAKSGLGGTVTGPDGTDTISHVQYLGFDDGTVRFYPGTGTSVNFSAAPTTFMGAIRDFDGNNLTGSTTQNRADFPWHGTPWDGISGWRDIGTADVNNDGRAEHVLVNQAIGRWATVSQAEDGLVYFSDYGWAGSTRIVGIYIDPLVQSGAVQRFSDFDSQQRFQNDLQIENIAKILGQGDYDHNGLQEIYFGLTDSPITHAYLHAYMHADGNIQYANYQSQQQVIDYLTANGFTSATWSAWFT